LLKDKRTVKIKEKKKAAQVAAQAAQADAQALA